MSKKTLTLFNHQNGKIPFVPHENCNEAFWRKRGEMGKTVASGETVFKTAIGVGAVI